MSGYLSLNTSCRSVVRCYSMLGLLLSNELCCLAASQTSFECKVLVLIFKLIQVLSVYFPRVLLLKRDGFHLGERRGVIFYGICVSLLILGISRIARCSAAPDSLKRRNTTEISVRMTGNVSNIDR